jgi:AcrR family transcriptional regulator
MPRPQIHTADGILDAARDLVLTGGARAATVNGIVAASGAPKGSIYHRFGTLDDLLGAMWLRGVRRSQQSFIDALEHEDPVEAAVAAGLSIHDFAEREPADARLLAALRREDLVESVGDPVLRADLAAANDRVTAALVDLARRLYGDASRAAVERAVCASVDLPQGAIRRHLVAAAPFPPGLRDQLEAAIRAALQPEEGRTP